MGHSNSERKNGSASYEFGAELSGLKYESENLKGSTNLQEQDDARALKYWQREQAESYPTTLNHRVTAPNYLFGV